MGLTISSPGTCQRQPKSRPERTPGGHGFGYQLSSPVFPGGVGGGPAKGLHRSPRACVAKDLKAPLPERFENCSARRAARKTGGGGGRGAWRNEVSCRAFIKWYGPGVGGWGHSTGPRTPTIPPPLGASGQQLVAKGATLRHPWAPKAPEGKFCPLCTPTLSLNPQPSPNPTPIPSPSPNSNPSSNPRLGSELVLGSKLEGNDVGKQP